MPPRVLSTATDNIYHNRYVLYHLDEGNIISSRDYNWQSMILPRVKMLELVIRQKRYRIDKADLPSGFVEFIHFRSKGMTWKLNTETGLHTPEEFNSWTIGWSDGANEHLVEIDFSTGDILRRYDNPIVKGKETPTHYHPQSLVHERGPR